MLQVERDGATFFGFYRSESGLEATCKRVGGAWLLLLWEHKELWCEPEKVIDGWVKLDARKVEDGRTYEAVRVPSGTTERAKSATDAIRRCLEWMRATEDERVAALVQLNRVDAAATASEAARVMAALKAKRRAAV